MDSLTKSVVFCGSVPLVVNGRRYSVQALPIAEVIGNDDFQTSGLYLPADDEPISNWQAIYMQDERYRNALDKWLKRLLTLNGEPQSLENIAAAQWTTANIGEFLSLVLKASGLTRKKAEPDKEPTPPDVWLDVLSEYQYYLHRSWNEVTAMPLLQLNALREKVLQYAANDSRGLLNGLMGGGNADGTPNSSVRAGYDKFFDDCRGNNPPTFKTRQEYEAYQAQQNKGMAIPKFKSRDEYFAWANSHR